MTADPRALAELLEESQDLQADALRPTHAALDELVEQPCARRGRPGSQPCLPRGAHAVAQASFAGAPLLGAAGGVALVGVLASAAAASSSSDVQILQTAASIENLAVATYKTALTLPYIGGSAANPVVTKFAQVTMGQHAQHADAFNAAVKRLGGKAQNKPDPAFVPVVNKAVASLSAASRPKVRSASWVWPSSSRTSRPRPTSRTRRWPRRRPTRRCSPASWASRRNTSPCCWPCRRS